MFCKRHPAVALQSACGESLCGACFAEQMERERMAAPKFAPAPAPSAAKKGFVISPEALAAIKAEFEAIPIGG